MSENTIYHYTTLKNFKNIIEQGVLRASHYKEMNDTSEIDFGIARIAKAAKEIANAENIENHIKRLLNETNDRLGLNFFIASFCEHPDDIDGLLNMWRGYSLDAHGTGIAIGFNKSSFSCSKENVKHGTKFEGMALVIDEPINYCSLTDELNPAYNEILKNAANYILSQNSENSNCQIDEKDGVKCIMQSLILLKHHAFSEEREYRLCVIPNNAQNTIKVDSSCAGPVRTFIEINFEMCDINSIIIGPNHNQDHIKNQVNMIFNNNNYKNAPQISLSSIPFKPSHK